MKTCNTMGLSILAGGMAFVGSANAVDLVINGSFEQPPGVGWNGSFLTYNYTPAEAYYSGPAIPASENPGNLYSWRQAGPAGFTEPLFQTVDLTLGASPEDIDGNRGSYTFSAWLASYAGQPDRPYVTVRFFDASGTTQLGNMVAHDRLSDVHFVTFADGTTTFDRTTHEHHWAKYVTTNSIPAGARLARVGVTRSPNSGVSGNPDTYTDLVKLDVTVGSSVPGADVVGQWDFDNLDLAASCGRSLEFFDMTVQLNTTFGTSDSFGLPQLDGQSVNVMKFPGRPPEGPMNGYKMLHEIPGNGDGTNVNQYTLVFDILYPETSHNLLRALLQTDPDNSDVTADLLVSEGNGVGVDGVYDGAVQFNQWHRIAFAVDLSGAEPSVAKFIDGVKAGQQTLGTGRDARWSLSADPANPWALLFAGGDGEVQPGYVSSIQLRNGRMSDAQIVGLGGPSASKIPGCIRIAREDANVVVRWTGGVVLQTATDVAGPWTDLTGVTSPYTLTDPLSAVRFYRPKP